MLDRALDVDQPLFALLHELLQHVLELGVRASAGAAFGGRILQRLDREVDLSVLLDRANLRLDDVSFSEMWTSPRRPSSSFRNAP